MVLVGSYLGCLLDGRSSGVCDQCHNRIASAHFTAPGKSLEVIPQGTIHLKIGNDHFTWYVYICVMGASTHGEKGQSRRRLYVTSWLGRSIWNTAVI